ncbi:hypothetical protein CsSME_00016450 [Camellia sinensis var. sinensis]
MANHFVLLLSALSVLSALANGSIFTPAINAKKVSYVSHAVTQGTNPNDVKGLAALQSQFSLLQSWTGDPCLGLITWLWIQCTSDPTTPRVTSLDLGSYGLVGSLPDFSSMDALQTIDFSNNLLNGPVPDFLGTLPNLQELNLANNDFQGKLPASILKNNNLTIVVSGNTNLCASDNSCQTTNTNNKPNSTPQTPSYSSTSNNGSSSKLPAILGASISIFLVFWVIVGIVAILHHKRKSAAVAILGAGSINGTPQGAAMNAQMTDHKGEAVANEQVMMDQQGHENENRNAC